MRVVSLLLLLTTGSAFAYDAPPLMSYAKPVAGGKFVLVMLRPDGNDFKRDLRERYGKSGLYPADDPTRPLWTCDWHADYERNVAVSADGVYAVRVADADAGLRRWLLSFEKRPAPTPADGWQDRPAAWVYRNGQLVRTLAVKDVFSPARFTDRDLYMGPVITIDASEGDTGRVWVSVTHENDARQWAIIDPRSGGVTDRHGGGLLDDSPLKCGNDGSPSDWGRWAVVMLVGSVVVGVGAAAVLGLAVLLIRRQGRPR